MAGAFSSTEQAQADPANFRDVHLHMAPIWVDRSDGPWLYVEQAMATSLDKPYRQRVYRLSANSDGTFTSAVYKLPEEPPERLAAFIGAWSNPTPFATLSPSDLTELDGCAITLTRRSDGAFAGGTRGTGCVSTRQGAAYTTSVVTITPTTLESWDRGFDAAGSQVWGATAGGYRFVKQPAR
jgi:hypothetical protein